MIRYACRHELLPVIEGELAANGYIVEPKLSRYANDSSLLIMTREDGGVLMTYDCGQDVAQIDLWGSAQIATSLLLEDMYLLPASSVNATVNGLLGSCRLFVSVTG